MLIKVLLNNELIIVIKLYNFMFSFYQRALVLIKFVEAAMFASCIVAFKLEKLH